MAKQAPKKIARKAVKPAANVALAKSAHPASAAKAQAKPPAAKPVAARPVKVARPAAPAVVRPASRLTPTRESFRRDITTIAPAVPVTPVPTNGKPRKNQAGITPRELEHFRDLLLAKRREIVGDMSQMEREALRSAGGSNLSNLPLHMADMGTDNYEQEFTLGLVQKERDLLREINSALAKIMDGTYGVCEGTGKPISKVRLEAQPWARYSIEFARQKEKGFMR